MEQPVARDRDRAGERLGVPGEQQPAATAAQKRLEVLALVQIAIGGLRPPHRLPVGTLERGAGLRAGVRPLGDLDPPAAALVAADLLAKALADPTPGARVRDPHLAANGPSPEGRVGADPIAEEEADQP